MHIKLKKLLKISSISIASFILILALLFLFIYIGVFGPLPSKEELAAIHKEEASLVYSSDGSLLGKFFAENRTNISRNKIPDHLLNALIATEDKRFFEHKGYDIKSYFRVFFKTILMGNRKSGGGSTLSQQLIKNLYGRNDHNFLSMPINKVKEGIIAARLEKVYSKEEVLVLYLNSVPFGENVYGIEAASIRYFDKNTYELNIQESAVLVGLLKANTFYNPRLHPINATKRRNQVIHLMAKENYISKAESDSLKITPLVLSYANYQKNSPAPYFVEQVKRKVKEILAEKNYSSEEIINLEKDGLKIYTSLNIKMQKFAQQAVKNKLQKMQPLLDKQIKRDKKRWRKSLEKKYTSKELDEIQSRELFNWTDLKSQDISKLDSLWHYYKMLHAAVLITEPGTGKVLTWIGGNNHRYLPYDMIYSKRQIASAIKPFVYAAAIENGESPSSYLENETQEYEKYKGWKPENYDHKSTPDSSVALWYSLANSMNLPTLDLYFKTGHKLVADLLRRMNLNPPQTETPAMALGALDVSLYEIVRAYATFANNGLMPQDLQMIDRIEDSKGNIIFKNKIEETNVAILAKDCEQINAILQKAINEGTGRSLRSRYGFQADLAGKTGTAQNYSNAWFISYTPNMVIGTWVGARSPEVHFNNGLGSGSALALPISAEILKKIEADKNLNEFYLTEFNTDSTYTKLLNCPPYFEKGINGFINRLTHPETAKDSIKREKKKAKKEKRAERKANRKKKKKKTKVGKFFQKLFGGKKDEK